MILVLACSERHATAIGCWVGRRSGVEGRTCDGVEGVIRNVLVLARGGGRTTLGGMGDGGKIWAATQNHEVESTPRDLSTQSIVLVYIDAPMATSTIGFQGTRSLVYVERKAVSKTADLCGIRTE